LRQITSSDLSKRVFLTQNGSQVHFPLLLGPVADKELAAPSSAVPLHENW